MNSSAENKRIIAEAFDGLARADARAFLDAMADDFTWIIEGQCRFSRRYEGKQAVRDELIPPLFATSRPTTATTPRRSSPRATASLSSPAAK